MKRKYFSKQFKLEALRLLDSSDKSGAELARELGVRRNQPLRAVPSLYNHQLQKRLQKSND